MHGVFKAFSALSSVLWIRNVFFDPDPDPTFQFVSDPISSINLTFFSFKVHIFHWIFMCTEQNIYFTTASVQAGKNIWIPSPLPHTFSLLKVWLSGTWPIYSSTSPIQHQNLIPVGTFLFRKSAALAKKTWKPSFYVLYSTLLDLLPLRFHCVGGCWERIQDCCDFGIGSQTL
jgi:hypothetical protein